MVFFIRGRNSYNDNFEEFTSFRFILTLVWAYTLQYDATNELIQLQLHPSILCVCNIFFNWVKLSPSGIRAMSLLLGPITMVRSHCITVAGKHINSNLDRPICLPAACNCIRI